VKLKTKLVVAITFMVFALVAAYSYAYLSQLVRMRITEAYTDTDFIARQIFNSARQAVEIDLDDSRVRADDPRQVHDAIAESLHSDPGLNTLLQSIIGYSPIIYDAAIVDTEGVALLHTAPDLIGRKIDIRDEFSLVRDSNFWRQVKRIYETPHIYEIRLPINRDHVPFGEVRVGISMTFLKNELKPQMNRALLFSALTIVISMLLAAGLSHLALRPLKAIGHRLDRLSAGEVDTVPDQERRKDEFGAVSAKIDRVGRQMRDVKEVFSALKENLDQLMANLQDGLVLFTRDARIVLVSASAEQFVGRPRSEMLGCQVDEVFDGTTPLGRTVMRAFRHHESIEATEVRSAAGRTMQVSLDFIEEGGEQIGALLTMRDSESVRRIEDEIELSRRLAAIGRLTSGVAHEVKNPINAIVVHLEILREKLRELDPDTRRHMDVIGSEIHRLDRVVQTLVDFTKPVELRLSDVDLRRVVDEVVMLSSAEAGRHSISVARQLPQEPLPVKVDADLVKQAILNVVLNGVQAMPNGGNLTISAARFDSTVELAIQDEGGGIPPEIRNKIFNLYFTTKKKGSGIGLAMAYRVMQLHNGSIEFDSEEGRGTTFRLRFPIADTRHSAAESVTATS